MKEDRIEVGDMVDVDIAKDMPIMSGRVEYIPRGSGDCWIIKGSNDVEIMYIQTFRMIRLVQKGKP